MVTVLGGTTVVAAAKSVVRDVGRVGGGGRGARGGAGRGAVDAGGLEGTARVVLPARGRTAVVLAALGDTLVAPLGTGEVGQGQAVLGDVGLLPVAADAAVGKDFLGWG